MYNHCSLHITRAFRVGPALTWIMERVPVVRWCLCYMIWKETKQLKVNPIDKETFSKKTSLKGWIIACKVCQIRSLFSTYSSSFWYHLTFEHIFIYIRKRGQNQGTSYTVAGHFAGEAIAETSVLDMICWHHSCTLNHYSNFWIKWRTNQRKRYICVKSILM